MGFLSWLFPAPEYNLGWVLELSQPFLITIWSTLVTYKKEVQFLQSPVELSSSSIQDLLRVRRQRGWGQRHDQLLHPPPHPLSPLQDLVPGLQAGEGRGKQHEGSYFPRTMVVWCWVPGWLRIRMLISLLWGLGLFFWGLLLSPGISYLLLPPLLAADELPLSPLSAGLLSLVVTWPPQAPSWEGAPLQVIQSGFLLQRPSLPYRISAVLSSPVWKCKLFTHQPPPFPIRHQALDTPTTLFFNSRDWKKLSEWFTWRPLIPAMYSEMAQEKVFVLYQ